MGSTRASSVGADSAPVREAKRITPRIAWHPKSVVVPGSMADGSHIVFGRGNADSLNSSAHGAGRAMSRRQAAQTIPAKSLMRMMGNIVYQKDRGHAGPERPRTYGADTPDRTQLQRWITLQSPCRIEGNPG